MGILITTSSLKALNVCEGSIEFFTGSFCISGNQWYSGSNYECYFEKNIVYPFTCSNAIEVTNMIHMANAFLITGSFYNKETNGTNFYYKPGVRALNTEPTGSTESTGSQDDGN